MTASLHIAVVGASGGIGAAIVGQLAGRDDIATIHATYYKSPAGGSLGSMGNFGNDARICWSKLDASNEASIEEWLSGVGHVDWLINCVGMLHSSARGPEKSIKHVDAEHFMASMSINCLTTILLAKHSTTALKASDNGIFATISARVGSIDDNKLGGWYSYRASKAALNMVLKSVSIEWQRTLKNVRVLALHPGTTDSRLSKPFQKNVPKGKLSSPEKTAALLIKQLDSAKLHPSGRFIAYDGQEIPW